ncbi:MAG: UDP-N-acetylmuramoylalanine-D-glutamate ligase [Berkelbacteria bacterium GW2011_GWA2_46_7]|uniref:UDP-N-acetylmuramoylalanine-D-glutamate ligase n=1 Tax=Berkelbacteria bacterium GW2011_GWA2_46_7 TaxID=1618335 RepID=A0A0G1QFS6_9BACT|nr:MAG: UDP-N-acetylmuramoylalanine-D-glutamate ligase [Berkelbacteria bacterium GW2011_GWA2_46_7]
MQITSWQDFAGKNVALLGAGIENLALIPHLLAAGAKVTVADRGTRPDFPELNPSVRLVTGDKYLEGLDQYDIVFRIAGLPVATLEEALKDLKIRPEVSSPTDLFLALSPCQTIGVTGSKGKGTTSTMIGSILKASGKKVVVVGNIGHPMFDCFKDLERDSFAIIELSSFQLEDLSHSPDIAVILAITENDHLQPLSNQNPNYHASVNDYVAAKAQITIHQTSQNHLVYVADNDYAISIAQVSKAKKTSVSQLSKDADFFVDQAGVVWTEGKELVDLSKLGLRGQHVFLNTTVAIAVARILHCREVDIAQGIINFRPLPHRLELWIAGGSTKGASFDELARVVSKSTVKRAILIGQEAAKIKESLSHFAQNISVETPKTLAEAVKLAQKAAKNGDLILLSPACASKDMFQSAADRGDQFKRLVAEDQES